MSKTNDYGNKKHKLRTVKDQDRRKLHKNIMLARIVAKDKLKPR